MSRWQKSQMNLWRKKKKKKKKKVWTSANHLSHKSKHAPYWVAVVRGFSLYGSSNVSSVHETPSPNSSGLLLCSTDRYPFSDCLTHKVCREAETNLRKSKIGLKQFSNGIRAWDRSTEVFVENVGSLLTMNSRGCKTWFWGRVSPAGGGESRRGEGQSSEFALGSV